MTEIEWRAFWCGRPMEDMTKQELIEIIRQQHEDMQRLLRANAMRLSWWQLGDEHKEKGND